MMQLVRIHAKIQKFLGHPEAVCCMIFTDDGEYILLSLLERDILQFGGLMVAKKSRPAVFLANFTLSRFLKFYIK